MDGDCLNDASEAIGTGVVVAKLPPDRIRIGRRPSRSGEIGVR